MERIAVITYNASHKKTQDLLLQLKARGHQDVSVLAIPWETRKNFKPLFIHRPISNLDISPQTLCENLGYEFKPFFKTVDLSSYIITKQFDYVLVGGAGILPGYLVEAVSLYNSHPGYLPESRGLDALKWAIYYGRTIGVTLHIVDEQADAGRVLYREKVNIEPNDSFDSLASRVYDKEIELLSDIYNIKILLIGCENNGWDDIDFDRYKPTRRMSHSLELQMMKRFKYLRDKPLDNWE